MAFFLQKMNIPSHSGRGVEKSRCLNSFRVWGPRHQVRKMCKKALHCRWLHSRPRATLKGKLGKEKHFIDDLMEGLWKLPYLESFLHFFCYCSLLKPPKLHNASDHLAGNYERLKEVTVPIWAKNSQGTSSCKMKRAGKEAGWGWVSRKWSDRGQSHRYVAEVATTTVTDFCNVRISQGVPERLRQGNLG